MEGEGADIVDRDEEDEIEGEKKRTDRERRGGMGGRC